ncbi:3-hydroxyanthranilate 3,4-dioxygenase isoform X2 [Hyla sarda]|uniref:3-hydroxyanthranilate 3,4-dioxygenase isoform X2 n=1 Tax=Hyla sarda TaxID=327740 RepID=UPI0024C20C9A|nr:3-hydroxyanthranilate 3,4-dioxygenase isoform X2 [Hyla sarda]XP_056424122.1 3-hydroxyanthranilate 3,4-dioxygenase isoform X2 [Hyla sarda]XP_056424123.1 3-hydroxyanthranilate 3,4-dioxygenase isoform X2 [Hyla sarda]
MESKAINVTKWIKENKASFLPPVCNKLMHNNQLTVMFVGGPNQRKDYHIEEGEELFYQLEGDMCLKIIENGEHKDINIKEGEMFLLPARIPHSPQRFPHTVGLVFERRRSEAEKDGLRYYVNNSTEVLFEKWFHCEDLGVQLAPIINEFFNSKQYKTGKPDPDQIPQRPPFPINTEKVMEAFSFQSWLDTHRSEIEKKKSVSLFEDRYETKATVYGEGETRDTTLPTDTWLWQLEGSSVVSVGDKVLTLTTGDSLLIPLQTKFSWKRHDGCIAFCVCLDPAQRKPYN